MLFHFLCKIRRASLCKPFQLRAPGALRGVEEARHRLAPSIPAFAGSHQGGVGLAMKDSYLLLTLFTAAYGAQVLVSLGLEGINRSHVLAHLGKVPKEFEGWIDSAKMVRMSRYALDKSRLGLFEEIISEISLFAILFLGALTGLESLFSHWEIPYLFAGILFFLIPAAILHLIHLPFSYRYTFFLEEAYGFNRSTPDLWLADQFKLGFLSALIISVILCLILWIIELSPDLWWVWGFLTVSAVQFALVGLYPVLIAPLFNKFEPVQDEVLEGKIAEVMERNGMEVKRILQMNAGLRSRHTNAYFTGIGKKKQIVLFDTLIESHPHDEILAILAHEVGHLKEKHVLKQLFFFEVLLFSGFYATHLLLHWEALYEAFGFSLPKPYIGLFLLSVFWQKAGFFLQPAHMALSRHFERRADLFAARFLGATAPLIASFRRLADDNLANLNPHPLYVLFHYSHPPLIERIQALHRVEG